MDLARLERILPLKSQGKITGTLQELSKDWEISGDEVAKVFLEAFGPNPSSVKPGGELSQAVRNRIKKYFK